MKVAALIFFLALVRPIAALTPGDLSRVRFDPHPGVNISTDLTFQDENNQPYRLGDHLRHPTLLILGYYRCPMLCNFVNDGLIQALRDVSLSVGRDFDVVDLSIDPNEKAAAAADRRSQYLRRYGREGAAQGWHCLVGGQNAIARIADEVGFDYVYDPATREYAHPSGVIVLAPGGRVSSYLSGVTFHASELNRALVRAKDGETVSISRQILLMCYHYNPITGKYGATVMTLVRVGGIATIAGIVALILTMTRRERRTRPRIPVEFSQG